MATTGAHADESTLAVPLYDGAEMLVVERSPHGNYCDFRVVRQDGSSLIFIGGYAQRLQLDVFDSADHSDRARLAVGGTYIGLMSVEDGNTLASFLGIGTNQETP